MFFKFSHQNLRIINKSTTLKKWAKVQFLIYDRILNLKNTNWQQKIKATTPTELTTRPKQCVGIIGSGEKVIDDKKKLLTLIHDCSELKAVAMEGYGVARAVEHCVRYSIGFLEIRGISDFASNKNDDWQPYAANAAAVFTMALLRSRPFAPLSPEKILENNIRQKLQPISSEKLLKLKDMLKDISDTLTTKQLRAICNNYLPKSIDIPFDCYKLNCLLDYLANIGGDLNRWPIPPILSFITGLLSFISEPKIKNDIRKWVKGGVLNLSKNDR
jgi:hypothetical protein